MKSEQYSDDEEPDTKPAAHTATGLKRGRKSLKTPDTAECFRTRGPGKGERSYKLSQDLFEGRHSDFIYVCHGCYRFFDTEKKLSLHKEEVHPAGVSRGEHHTADPNQFRCPRCAEFIAVKHLVWFVKHLRFCGEDEDLANSLIGPDDYSSDEEDNPSFRKKYSKRPPVDLYKVIVKNLVLFNTVLGINANTVNDDIWKYDHMYILIILFPIRPFTLFKHNPLSYANFITFNITSK